MSWTSRNIEAVRQELLGELDEKYPTTDFKGRIHFLLENLDRFDQTLNPIEKFIHCVCVLEIQTQSMYLAESDYQHVLKIAKFTLGAEGIKREGSRLSYLHGELHLIQGKISLNNGEMDQAVWEAELATAVLKQAPQNTWESNLIFQGDALLRMGHARLASIRYKTVFQKEFTEESTLRLIESDRWSGNFVEALKSCEKLSDEQKIWFKAVIQLQIDRQIEIFIKVVQKSVTHPYHKLLAKLWVLTSNRRSLYDKFPKADSLRRAMTQETSATFNHRIVVSLLRTLEESYDSAIPIENRLQKMGEIFSSRKKLPTVELELLALGAILRGSIRFRQNALAQVVSAEYISLSRQLSSGTNSDALNAFDDIDLYSFDFVSHKNTQVVQRSRTGQFISTAAKGVGIVATSHFKSFLASTNEKRRIKEEEYAKLGSLMAESFGSLKGGLMKVGQLLSMVADISPQFSNPLRRMHLEAEPTPYNQIAEIIESELGGKPENIFEIWDQEPIAIGSIGQVHRAKLKSGEYVVVKVQHPHIEQSLATDLRILSIIRPMIKNMFPRADTKAIITEIKNQILSEMDYRREVKNQKAFRQIFSGNPSIVVPQIFPGFCTDKIITSEYVSGRTFEDFCEQATAEEKNQAGEVVVEFYLNSIWPNQMFNCDPHTNNFVFLDDGRIAFLDYGCVKNWNLEFVHAWQQIILATIGENMDGCFDGFVKTGLYDPNENVDRKLVLKTAKIMLEPLIKNTAYKFSHEFVKRNSDALYFANNDLKRYLNPPAESTMLIRFAWGLYTILADLEATANWHRLVVDHFEDTGATLKKTS